MCEQPFMMELVGQHVLSASFPAHATLKRLQTVNAGQCSVDTARLSSKLLKGISVDDLTIDADQ